MTTLTSLPHPDLPLPGVSFRGRTMRELLKQKRFTGRSIAEQVVLLTAVSEASMPNGPPPDINEWKTYILETARDRQPHLMTELDQGRLPDGWKEELKRVLEEFTTDKSAAKEPEHDD